MKVLSILRQAYPVRESINRNWRVAILISLFVAVFMIIFQPFGLASISDKYKVAVLSGYGLVSFLVLVINLLLIERLFNEKLWKVYKELLWILWIVASIGLANYIYTISIFSIGVAPLKFFLRLELSTFAIGIFPVSIIVILRFQKLNRINSSMASKINKGIVSKTDNGLYKFKTTYTIKSTNPKENINLAPESILYIESKGNYVYIALLDDSGLKRHIQRNTLNSVIDQLSGFPDLIKCHRSFIINRNTIEQVSGNAQGLKLRLKGTEDNIPVSRPFIAKFR